MSKISFQSGIGARLLSPPIAFTPHGKRNDTQSIGGEDGKLCSSKDEHETREHDDVRAKEQHTQAQAVTRQEDANKTPTANKSSEDKSVHVTRSPENEDDAMAAADLSMASIRSRKHMFETLARKEEERTPAGKNVAAVPVAKSTLQQKQADTKQDSNVVDQVRSGSWFRPDVSTENHQRFADTITAVPTLDIGIEGDGQAVNVDGNRFAAMDVQENAVQTWSLPENQGSRSIGDIIPDLFNLVSTGSPKAGETTQYLSRQPGFLEALVRCVSNQAKQLSIDCKDARPGDLQAPDLVKSLQVLLYMCKTEPKTGALVAASAERMQIILSLLRPSHSASFRAHEGGSSVEIRAMAAQLLATCALRPHLPDEKTKMQQVLNSVRGKWWYGDRTISSEVV